MDTEIIFTNSPIDFSHSAVSSREIGAYVEFQGIVREIEGVDKIAGLRYEAYEPMARRQLLAHIAELSTVHPCASVFFNHRLGFVPVGEASLLVRVYSKHRGAAFAMCSELIDRLKADVPIWKI
jgi:molybdopterin synthase catalytic subunit